MGLVSLLPLQAELLPQELQSGLDQVFKAVLKLLVAYKQQLEGILEGTNLKELRDILMRLKFLVLYF